MHKTVFITNRVLTRILFQIVRYLPKLKIYLMKSRTKNIIGWTLTILLSAFFLFASAPGKFMGGPEMEIMFTKMGLLGNTPIYIGVLEITCVLLFLFPRTGVVGTLLLTSYMGGAIVSHLGHNEPFIFQMIITALIWITAFLRFPELGKRLLGK
jgi:hypothetical protein